MSQQKGRELISGDGKRYYRKIASEVILIIVVYFAAVIFFAQVEGFSVQQFLQEPISGGIWLLGLFVAGYIVYAVFRYGRWARTWVSVRENIVEGRGVARNNIAVETFSLTYEEIASMELVFKRALTINSIQGASYTCFCDLPVEVRLHINERMLLLDEEKKRTAEKAAEVAEAAIQVKAKKEKESATTIDSTEINESEDTANEPK